MAETTSAGDGFLNCRIAVVGNGGVLVPSWHQLLKASIASGTRKYSTDRCEGKCAFSPASPALASCMAFAGDPHGAALDVGERERILGVIGGEVFRELRGEDTTVVDCCSEA